MFVVDRDEPDPRVLQRCAHIWREGGLVAFPTETVYGLGAWALNDRAVRRIFTAKGRPADNPLIVHVAGAHHAWRLAEGVPPVALRLAEAFWPGPLTIVLRKKSIVPAVTTAGLPTFGVRVPAHPVALALLRHAGLPVAAPSANVSGKPSPTSARHVWQDLAGRIDAVVDGGFTDVGLESTVVDVTGDVPVILRPGGVSRERLETVVGRVAVHGEGGRPLSNVPGAMPPPSPGMKYRHYAPEAKVTVVSGSPEDVAAHLRSAFLRYGDDVSPRRGSVGGIVSSETARILGLLPRPGFSMTRSEDKKSEADLQVDLPVHWPTDPGAGPVAVLGSRGALSTAARRFYAALRAMDEAGVSEIILEAFDEKGIGWALSDRARRAADPGVDPDEPRS